MTGVEAGGLGIIEGKHAARFFGGKIGVLQGTKTYVLQNADGQVNPTHSVSAGLDYAAVGPEHAMHFDSGRVVYSYVEDEEAVNAFNKMNEWEGILPALETSHGIAHAIRLAPDMSPDQLMIVNLSGRGDKDVMQIVDWEESKK